MTDLLPEWVGSMGIVLFGLVVVMTIAVGIIIHIRKRKRFDVSKISITDIDQMSGHEFEDYLYVLFVALGYEETFLTKKSRDFGADLLFRDRSRRETVVQAKRITEKVGLDAVQEIFAAQAYYQADKAVIITTAKKLSEPCMKLAAATKVSIIARDDLIEMIRCFKRGKVEEAQDLVELSHEEIEYNSDDSLDDVDHQRGFIKAGDYFYKL
ncbi:restriction endonuclease [Alkalihalobacillus sp. MEB130]|uniref:restriction endonuclease n=1 Tax=Alkalihalobacillus sp. MEB130 TaxID=2976704 RepID=UPI0028DE5F48|nr:restriction endonuclease [Alkalihalobacillus sp. MEB130]MDT8862984.1 restriction endonuclease [Alkalihalobacillus sp. MEB130]